MGSKKSIPGMSGSGPATSWIPGLRLVNSLAVSGTTVYLSDEFNAASLDNLGLQIIFTGTMTGTLEVQFSIDNKNFISLTFSPALAQPAGSSISYLINLNQIPFPYMKIKYTNASGSGTLDVWLSGKDLN